MLRNLFPFKMVTVYTTQLLVNYVVAIIVQVVTIEHNRLIYVNHEVHKKPVKLKIFIIYMFYNRNNKKCKTKTITTHKKTFICVNGISCCEKIVSKSYFIFICVSQVWLLFDVLTTINKRY